MTITSLLVLIFLSSSSVWAADAFGSPSLAKSTPKVMRKPAAAATRRCSSSLLALRGVEQGETVYDTDSQCSEGEKISPSTFGKLASVAIVPPLSSFASFYALQLRTRPIQTKSVTAGVIFGMSDYFAQTIERNKSDGEK
ncbi:hypothetical protein QTG54_002776 [Skeletonema marinoi]|uniref:Uncharacterized protein n=1 Tax=Skeletonema marinoi TaxID=267567 RepID=A0AAD8YGI6_9STRA|nr:hypothetical protein QTG54_002776 [Skeletonema marinoi]